MESIQYYRCTTCFHKLNKEGYIEIGHFLGLLNSPINFIKEIDAVRSFVSQEGKEILNIEEYVLNYDKNNHIHTMITLKDGRKAHAMNTVAALAMLYPPEV